MHSSTYVLGVSWHCCHRRRSAVSHCRPCSSQIDRTAPSAAHCITYMFEAGIAQIPLRTESFYQNFTAGKVTDTDHESQRHHLCHELYIALHYDFLTWPK